MCPVQQGVLSNEEQRLTLISRVSQSKAVLGMGIIMKEIAPEHPRVRVKALPVPTGIIWRQETVVLGSW